MSRKMNNYELFRFEWPVSVDGYQIEKVEVIGAGLLGTETGETTECVYAIGKETEIYEPLKQYTGLFYDFSETEQNKTGILEFANRYGLLKHGPNELDMWMRHIELMRRVINAWHSGAKIKGLIKVINIAMEVDARIDPETLEVHFWPRDLLSALWIQFGLAVSGQKQYRKCAWCGSAFEISPRVARTNRLFCSNACKQADYRDRAKRKQS
jgi:endogenous inhibitor of DNA gyrase (YacG/DUF329 family)